MVYEERRVAQEEPVETVDTVPAEREVVHTVGDTVVEHRPVRRTVVADEDPLGTVYAASHLIQTIVWAVVVLVLLVVVLIALHVYAGLL
mgnify:CR=1 FL=1